MAGSWPDGNNSPVFYLSIHEKKVKTSTLPCRTLVLICIVTFPLKKKKRDRKETGVCWIDLLWGDRGPRPAHRDSTWNDLSSVNNPHAVHDLISSEAGTSWIITHFEEMNNDFIFLKKSSIATHVGMMVTFWIGERNSFTIVIIIIFCMYSGHSLDWFISSGCHLVILYGKTESVCEVVIVWHVVSKSVYMMLFLSWIKTRDLCTGIFESLYRKKGSLVEQCEPHLSFSIFFLRFFGRVVEIKNCFFYTLLTA